MAQLLGRRRRARGESPPRWRWPAFLAALATAGYLGVALVVLGPSIRPGHTLVPADTLTLYSPYREQAGGFRADNPIVSDAATQFFPWYRFLAAELRHGRIPQWNPGVLGGVPVTPNGYVSAYYPPFWLGAVLSTYDAYDLFVLLHLVLGALGIYAFGRVLGAGRWSAWVIGILGFAAGSWLHWSLHLLHLAAMAWLPWAMAVGQRLVERPTPGRVGLLAGVLGLWWLGANPQYAYLGGLAAGGYLLAQVAWLRLVERQAVARPVAGLVLAAVAGGLVAAPVLLPTLAGPTAILRGHEPVASVSQTHLPLRHAIRLLVPDASGGPGRLYASTAELEMDSPFVGLVTVLLCAGAVVAASRRRNALLLAAGAALVLVLAFTGPPNALAHAVLPGYDRFRGSARWTAVLPAFALPLAALGLDALLAGDRRARRAVMGAAAVAVATVAVWLLREQLVPTAPHGYFALRGLLAAVVAGGVSAAAVAAVAAGQPRSLAPTAPASGRSRLGRLAAGVILGCVLVELLATAPGWYPDVLQHAAYPQVPALTLAGSRGGRLVRVGGPRQLPTYLPPDVPLAYGVAEVSGLSPFFPSDYDRYLRLIDDYGTTALELNVAPPLASSAALASPLLAVLDVRTVVVPTGKAVEWPRSLGPAVLVPDARPAEEAAMWAAIAAPGWDPMQRSFVRGLPRPVAGGPGTVTRAGEEGSGTEGWLVEAPRGGLLRVSGRYERGWSARVDGQRSRVLRADGVFRAVVVPPGRHTVTFAYRSPRETQARALAGVGLASLLGLAGWRLAQAAGPWLARRRHRLS